MIAVAPEHRFLLAAALHEDERWLPAWHAWRGGVDPRGIDVPAQRVLPLLSRRLRGLAPGDPICNIVHGLYRHTWATNRLLWAHAVPVLETFERRGVAFALLKGAALLSVFGDWGTRRMFDVDVLVRPADLDVALTALDEHGWRPEFLTIEGVKGRAVAARHSVGFENGSGGQLDLHWHVLADSIGVGADDAFWDGRVPAQADARSVYALHPADMLLNVLMHGPRGDVPAASLQWIVDAVVVGRRYGTGVGGTAFAQRLAEQARSHGQLRTTTECLQAIESIVEDRWVSALLEQLSQRRGRVVERLRRRPDQGRGWDHAMRALARHAAGGSGLRRGAVGLVRDRLQLDLACRPAVATLLAATGRTRPVGRLARRALGPLVRTATPPAAPLEPGAVLDLTVPTTFDQFCGPGWAATSAAGALTRGSESRLILPVAATLRGCDLLVSLELSALEGELPVDVRANESRVYSGTVGPAWTTLAALIPRGVARRFAPLELSLRRSPGRPWRFEGRGLRLRRLELHEQPIHVRNRFTVSGGSTKPCVG
jgi:hypothetical protein